MAWDIYTALQVICAVLTYLSVIRLIQYDRLSKEYKILIITLCFIFMYISVLFFLCPNLNIRNPKTYLSSFNSLIYQKTDRLYTTCPTRTLIEIIYRT